MTRIVNLSVLLASILALNGCASGGSTANCPYRSLIGKSAYSADVDALRGSGKEVRLLYPDSFLGFESKPDRVNITRDESDEIVSVTCG